MDTVAVLLLIHNTDIVNSTQKYVSFDLIFVSEYTPTLVRFKYLPLLLIAE